MKRKTIKKIILEKISLECANKIEIYLDTHPKLEVNWADGNMNYVIIQRATDVCFLHK